jgi:hypothetical protein
MNPFLKKASVVNNEELSGQIKADLREAESITDSNLRMLKLKELAKVCMNARDLDLTWDVIQTISDENARNLMIAQLIEEYLIPSHEYAKAKEYSKYLVSDHEITTLILIRLALAEGHIEQAIQYVEQLPTPLSRNYAFCHIVEAYLQNNEKGKALEIGKMMIENARAISDPELRSFLLRDVAKNFFLANGEKELAIEVVNYIGDETLKQHLLMNIECS